MRLALVALIVLLAGCGSHRSGRAVFVHECASCHAPGRDGGDLRGGRLGLNDIESFTRAMPVKLSPRDVRAVSLYVQTMQRSR